MEPSHKKPKLRICKVGFLGAGDISTLHASGIQKLEGPLKIVRSNLQCGWRVPPARAHKLRLFFLMSRLFVILPGAELVGIWNYKEDDITAVNADVFPHSPAGRLHGCIFR
jgi:hypothetical protein